MGLSRTEVRFHEKTRARCFNEAWEYLEKKRRSASDERTMLNLAHAARFHSDAAGTPRNRAIGDWQISRTYAALREPRLALLFARSSLEVCEANDLSDLRGTAFEAVARAYAVSNDVSSAGIYLARARRQLDRASLDKEDREIYLAQIRDTERLIRQATRRRAP